MIGLVTFMTFDVEPGGKRDNLFEVTRRYWEAGGRVIDTSPLYGMGGQCRPLRERAWDQR
jgi:aryl-alcohol dehydrogenase-like predicted oxidoreductase